MQNFENPVLMRNVGLILENVDGFNNLQGKFAMRGVPHTLALPTSLRPVPPDVDNPDGTTMPPDHRTGWGGDGAPFNEFVLLGDGATHSIGNLQVAATTSDQTQRNAFIQTAINQQNQARSKMIN